MTNPDALLIVNNAKCTGFCDKLPDDSILAGEGEFRLNCGEEGKVMYWCFRYFQVLKMLLTFSFFVDILTTTE